MSSDVVEDPTRRDTFAKTAMSVTEEMTVIHKPSDIITTKMAPVTKQSRISIATRKSRGQRSDNTQLGSMNITSTNPATVQSGIDPKVDCYSPKRLKQRVFTHERIKHRKEQRKAIKEKRTQ